VLQLLVVTLIMEAIRSSETSVITRGTMPNYPEDGILHSRRREYLKSYTGQPDASSQKIILCQRTEGLRSSMYTFVC
jgi:Na+-transporting NADH:ubiquinone oxidoreductase subunit NqrC